MENRESSEQETNKNVDEKILSYKNMRWENKAVTSSPLSPQALSLHRAQTVTVPHPRALLDFYRGLPSAV